MFKKIILMALVIVQWTFANSQTISRNIVASAGGTLSGGSSQLTYTVGETLIPTFSAGGNIITQGFQQPGEQLSTGSLPAVICSGSAISIPFTGIDIGGGNTFTVQLSNASGSFASPVTLGTRAGNSTAAINVVIPANTNPGTGYRIRVNSSFPALTGKENGTNISIAGRTKTAPTPGAITGTTDACPYVGLSTTVTYTIRTLLNATSYQWTAPVNAEIVGSATDTTVQIRFLSGFVTGTLKVQAKNSCSSNLLGTAKTLLISRKLPATPGTITGPTNPCPYQGGDSNAVYSIHSVPFASSYAWKVPTGALIVKTGNTTLASPADSVVTADTSIEVDYRNAISTGTIAIKVYSRSTCSQSLAKSLALTRVLPLTPGVIIASSSNICEFVGPNGAIRYTIRKVANAVKYSWKVPLGAYINASGNIPLVTEITYPDSLVTADTSILVRYHSMPPANSVLKVSAVNFCKMSANKTLAIAAKLPGVPTVLTSSPILTGGNVCPVIGSTATFSTALVAGALDAVWTVSGGASFVGSNYGTTVTVSFPFGFTGGVISVRSVSGCGNSATAKSMTLTTTKPATPASISGPATVCVYVGSATDATYTSAVVAGATSYQWTLPNGAVFTSGQGTRTITVHYNSFAEPDSIYVQASNGCALSAKRVMSLSGIGCRISTSKSQPAEKLSAPVVTETTAYPNPSNGDFTISINTASKATSATLELINTVGSVVKTQNVVLSASGHTLVKISGSDLVSGTYIARYRIGTETGNIKIVVLK